ncbi:hypothetical protein E4U53_006663 [Claviceps sorghi]|nr:hypothetical protein E4U53_006663 [Claviceps sorghi]
MANPKSENAHPAGASPTLKESSSQRLWQPRETDSPVCCDYKHLVLVEKVDGRPCRGRLLPAQSLEPRASNLEPRTSGVEQKKDVWREALSFRLGSEGDVLSLSEDDSLGRCNHFGSSSQKALRRLLEVEVLGT